MFNLDSTKLVDDRPFIKTPVSATYPYRQDAFDKRWVVKHTTCHDINHLMFVLQEIAIGYNCDHPAIVPIRAFSIEPLKSKGWNVYTKMTRMEESFKEMIERHKTKTMRKIEQDSIIYNLHTLACGLESLHRKRIPHRNIKPSNIMISWEGQVKLGGAGSTPFKLDGKEESVYLAPELCFPVKSTKKKELIQSDIWSLGAVLAEVCTLRSKTMTDMLASEDRGSGIKKIIEDIKEKYDVGLANIIGDMLTLNPKKRKTAKEVIKSLEERYSDVLTNYTPPKESASLDLDKSPREFEGIKLSASKSFHPKSSINANLHSNSILNDRQIPDVEEKRSLYEKANSNRNNGQNWGIFVKDMQGIWNDRFDLESDQPMYFKAIRKVGVTDDVLTSFASNLASKVRMYEVDRIKGLEMNLMGCEKITDQSLTQLSSTLSQDLNRLEKLTLQFSPWDFSSNITDDGLRRLSVDLGRQLTDLQQLTLSFSLYDSITDKGLSDLSLNVCEKLRNLQKLKLELSECRNITDLGVERLASHLTKFQRNLKQLTLNLYDCPKISEEGITYFISNVTQNLRDLETIGLDLSRSSISDDELKLLATSMANNLRNLKEINLKFEGCSRISDRGIMHLAKELGRNFEQLRELHLNFYDCKKISDESITFLASNIGQNLRNLRGLTLDFSRSGITDEGIKQISSQIIQNLRSLEQLNLNLYWCGGVTNDGVNYLYKAIHKNLTYLQQLKLNLCDCWEVADDTKETLKRGLSFVPKLTIE